jgi:hypothetical protein
MNTRVALLATMLFGCEATQSILPERLTLALSSGARIEAPANATTYVHLTAVGADDSVVFSLTNAPGFVTLNADVIKITPAPSDVGAHEFEVSATADGETDSKTLNVAVIADSSESDSKNSAPIVNIGIGFWLDATLGETEDDVTGCVATGVPAWGTRNVRPRLLGAAYDPDGDAIAMEAEFIIAGGEFTGMATHATAPEASTNLRLPVTGLLPKVTYAVATRVVDELGASPWVVGPETITCE